MNAGKFLYMKKSTESIFSVDDKFILNLREGICACKKYPDLGYPCIHFFCLIYHLKLYINEFILKYFSRYQIRNSYLFVIQPFISAFLTSDELNPPIKEGAEEDLKFEG